MPRGSRHLTTTFCPPAGTVTRSRPWSGFAGRVLPETVTSCTSASDGSVRTRASSRLARVVTINDVFVSRSPGVVSKAYRLQGQGLARHGRRMPEADGERLAGPGPELGARAPAR